ncbi:unnamed protein product [Orchesella dallaii]|uniref:Uncharacterized protein n=1 Tax=Orchesella dallaii TaxID=48710 RepID=A0ABP1QP64_9HEXA
MASSEFGLQIFLFVATILCYVVLFFCLMYGAYYCCFRSCILKHRRRQEEGEVGEVEEDRAYRYPYCDGRLLNPFRTEKDIFVA